jgi:hypothetical protein
MANQITKQQLIDLAIQAGFGEYESSNCSGESAFDEQICVGEYPCAENVLRLAEMLGVEVTE